MPQGKLEVLLVSAKGLEGGDFFSKVDPYVVLTCRTQEHKSSVLSGNPSPEWNETFLFSVSSSAPPLKIKIFDKDTFSADDFLGEADIPLEPVLGAGSLPVTAYNIVKDGEYCGEIKLGLNFKSEDRYDRDQPEEALGGWKDSNASY